MTAMGGKRTLPAAQSKITRDPKAEPRAPVSFYRRLFVRRREVLRRRSHEGGTLPICSPTSVAVRATLAIFAQRQLFQSVGARLDPLKNVALHVQQAKVVWREGANRGGVFPFVGAFNGGSAAFI